MNQMLAGNGTAFTFTLLTEIVSNAKLPNALEFVKTSVLPTFEKLFRVMGRSSMILESSASGSSNRMFDTNSPALNGLDVKLIDNCPGGAMFGFDESRSRKLKLSRKILLPAEGTPLLKFSRLWNTASFGVSVSLSVSVVCKTFAESNRSNEKFSIAFMLKFLGLTSLAGGVFVKGDEVSISKFMANLFGSAPKPIPVVSNRIGRALLALAKPIRIGAASNAGMRKLFFI